MPLDLSHICLWIGIVDKMGRSTFVDRWRRQQTLVVSLNWIINMLKTLAHTIRAYSLTYANVYVWCNHANKSEEGLKTILKFFQEIKASTLIMEKVESWECPLYFHSHVWVERLYLKTPNSKELVPCMLTHATPLLSNVTHMCGCGLKGWLYLMTPNYPLCFVC
jgi:hypothetical protein